VKKVPTNVNYPHAQKSDFYDAKAQAHWCEIMPCGHSQFLKKPDFCGKSQRFSKFFLNVFAKINHSNMQ